MRWLLQRLWQEWKQMEIDIFREAHSPRKHTSRGRKERRDSSERKIVS
jgi:hypothetical protein